jgi:hypothetical protein
MRLLKQQQAASKAGDAAAAHRHLLFQQAPHGQRAVRALRGMVAGVLQNAQALPGGQDRQVL